MTASHRAQSPAKMAASVPQPAIHLLKALTNRNAQTKLIAQLDGLEIYHAIQPSSEFEVTFTQHILTLPMSCTDQRNFRQISRFAEQEFNNVFSPGGFLLLPAQVPAFFWWNQTDESVIFNIEQTVLQRIANETNCLNPSGDQ